MVLGDIVKVVYVSNHKAEMSKLSCIAISNTYVKERSKISNNYVKESSWLR